MPATSTKRKAWHDWLLRAVAGSPDQVQIMYGIQGERNLLEWEIPWLGGYEESKPVRIGNAASEQLQLDVYGELADALLHAYLGGIRLNAGRHWVADSSDRTSGDNLEHARQRDLGGPRRAATLYLLQSDGLGGVRSRDQDAGEIVASPM